VNLPEVKDMSFILTEFKTSATNVVVKEYHLLKQADCGKKPKGDV